MIYPEDENILNLIISLDKRNEGFRYLVAKYKEKLYWHIRRMVENHEDADDVLQNTFLKVVKNIEGFQRQSSLFTWLYRIATNEGINFLNAKKNRYHEITDVSALQNVASYESVNETIVLQSLASAIKTLPDKQKLVFNLRYYDELPYQDIADITDTSVGALKASYHLAVKKIEEHLKKNV
ncbi:MAG: RNA polymerase sigma factor [Saprospiraceae bacterium]